MGIVLNGGYVILEVAWGVASHSLALISDAGHNLGDVVSLGLAWLASRLAKSTPSTRYTYGLRGSSILAALTNACLLLLITGGVAWEALMRFWRPEPVAGLSVMVVALGGIAVNALTAWLFAAGRKGDVNVRAAFQHMLADAVVALGVAVSGAAILVTHLNWIDPMVSLVVAGVIIWGTWSLLRESLDLALHAAPAGVDPVAVRAYLEALPGVREVHDLHIWGMSTTETALTAHIVRPALSDDDPFLHELGRELRSRFSVHHATVQVERGGQEICALAAEDVV